MTTATKRAIKDTRLLAHTFDEAEREAMNKNLADQILDVQKLEIEKKAVTADLNAKIKDLNTRNKRLAKWLHDGWEEREIAVEIQNHYPTDGKRTITRMDTHEQWVEEMSENTLDTWLDGEEE